MRIQVTTEAEHLSFEIEPREPDELTEQLDYLTEDSIGTLIGMWISLSDLSKDDVADRAEISITHLRNIVLGHSDPSLACLRRIAKALNLPLALRMGNVEAEL